MKIRNRKRLFHQQRRKEHLRGIECLIAQVNRMVRESGNPQGFGAAQWVSDWIRTSLPALNGKTPSAYMHAVAGRKLVSNLLAMAQSGAYA